MTGAAEIFVRLLEENVEVWRPVRAEQIAPGHFRIVDQPYDRGIERWEYEPGDEVLCKFMASSNGDRFLAAKRRL